MMRLENIVWDARDPHRLGAFWTAALNAVAMTDEVAGYEARLTLSADVFLDLGFQQVANVSPTPPRLRLTLTGGDEQATRVARLLELGAEHLDTGQGEVPWTVLADPEGNAFYVTGRNTSAATGPIAALSMDSTDPARDAAFWARITHWTQPDEEASTSLRHPAGCGPALEFCPESAPKQGKNRLHLDVRPTPTEAGMASQVVALGAHSIGKEDADLPWDVFSDPSGNEFCILKPSE